LRSFEPPQKVFFVDSIDTDFEIIVAKGPDCLSYALGKVFDQLFQVHCHFVKIRGGQPFEKPLPEKFSGIPSDRGVRVEARVQSSADIVEIQQAFA
jgi:hypothetical protein